MKILYFEEGMITKKMIELLFVLGCVVVCVFMSVVATASDDSSRGSEDITISGGARGNVFFPHRVHENSLQDCNVCHSVFPEVPGAIDEAKEKGTLKAKEVMNKTCIQCHRDQKMQGVQSGPTTCSKCHSSERR